LDSVKGLQQIGAQLARRRLRRHNVTPSCLSLILHPLGTADCDLDHGSKR
jgi:hypothetical protein